MITEPIPNTNHTNSKVCSFNVIEPDDMMVKLHVSSHSSNVRFNNQHSWSKSETNLSGKQLQDLGSNGVMTTGCGGGNSDTSGGAFKLSVFDVVSLNDLQATDEAPFSHASGGRQMNDLSKYHPKLNNISNDDICAKPRLDQATDE